MEKLYNKIDFVNNTTPALNATNLNRMSKGLDDVDTRVVNLAANIMEAVPEIREDIETIQADMSAVEGYKDQAEESAEDAEAWAVGTRDGEPVPSTDPAYENSSKYWAEQSHISAGVTSFNGRAGSVTPQSGDYTAAMVGAIAATDKGVNGGVAELNNSGKVPASQLQSMVGASESVAGTSGVVPAPAAGDQNKVLSGGGIWVPQPTDMISDAWASGNLYKVGDYRIYNNTLYKCNTEHTSTSSNYPGSSYGYWSAEKVGDALKSLNSGLSNILNEMYDLIGYPIIINGEFKNSAHIQNVHQSFTTWYDTSDMSMWLQGGSVSGNDGYITPLPAFSNYTTLKAKIYTQNGDSSIQVGFTASTNVAYNTFLTPKFIDESTGWHDVSFAIPSNAAYLGIHIDNYRAFKINKLWLE